MVEIKHEQAIMPDFFAAVPWHHAIRKIGTTTSEQQVVMDADEGTSKSDRIWDRREGIDLRRSAMSDGGHGKGCGDWQAQGWVHSGGEVHRIGIGWQGETWRRMRAFGESNWLVG